MTKVSCTVCHRGNDPWRKFCGGCGTGFAGACRCGSVNAAGDRYCGGCGVAVRNTLRVQQFADTHDITMKIAVIGDK